MLEGFLRYFDQADGAFVSAYRQYTNDDSFDIHIEYTNCPPLEGRPLVILDPMVATGRSIVKSWEALRIFGEPSHLFIAALIASEEGLDYVRRHIPRAQVYVGAVDAELTARAYIVPGLGDAGDLAYGAKEPHVVSADEDE
jgi:uracil phosphoribosyltransferase